MGPYNNEQSKMSQRIKTELGTKNKNMRKTTNRNKRRTFRSSVEAERLRPRGYGRSRLDWNINFSGETGTFGWNTSEKKNN